MDTGKGKEVQHATEDIPVGANDAQCAHDAQVINYDGKAAAVMITEKRSRAVTFRLDQNCVEVDGDGKCKGRVVGKYKKRSMVWDHVTESTFNENEAPQATCNYCKKTFLCDTYKNGTGHMKHHLEYKCPRAPAHIKKTDPLQKLLVNGITGVSSVCYNAEISRVALVEMIILDELPFKFVEAEGFRKLCAALQPKFSVPSRQTIGRDCIKLYKQEKISVMSSLKGKILCLTTDTWTSIQNINYMSLIAHYIDCDWVYHKKILNFCIVESHKGDALGKAIESCLLEWGIRSIFTVTLDNASANNGLIAHLKKRTRGWVDIICDHEFIHMRCAAHILNLVVNDGLKEVSDLVEKIRNAVRYVRSSPSRLTTFKRCAEKNRILSNQLLCLDVPTRWNSTYLMLSAAIRYKKAFESMEDDDVSYCLYFLDDDEPDESKKCRAKRLGPPQPSDFDVAENLVKYLKIFYDATLKLSASNSVSINTCFPELAVIQNTINLHICSGDPMLCTMAKSMKVKFDKYWGTLSKTNLLFYIATVLDPRRKFIYLRLCFKKLLGEVDGNEILSLIHDALTRLYMWFVVNGPSTSVVGQNNFTGTVAATTGDCDSSLDSYTLEAEFKRQLEIETNAKGSISELEQYLQDACMVGGENFDILCWWKLNSCRYPVVAQLAKQVLAVPVSTVASESCFSTGGRVLDVFRSSLSPENVEALICTQNWLKGSAKRGEDMKGSKTKAEEMENDYIATIDELGNDLTAKVNID